MEYDPEKITYEELLDVFWSSHAPLYASYSQQYASIIFYHDEEQRRLALASLGREELRIGGKVYTQVKPFTTFTMAEEYHQKYFLRSTPELYKEMSAIYPDFRDLINSTAAARINGYLGGNGSLDKLQKQISTFGLSDFGEKDLLDTGAQILEATSSNFCPITE